MLIDWVRRDDLPARFEAHATMAERVYSLGVDDDWPRLSVAVMGGPSGFELLISGSRDGAKWVPMIATPSMYGEVVELLRVAEARNAAGDWPYASTEVHR